MTDTTWLPPLIELQDYGGNWQRYLDAIYQKFQADFVYSRPSLDGKPFRLKCHPWQDGKEATFWHCISEGAIEEERILEPRRCERLGWIRFIIESLPHPRIKRWDTERRGDKRVVLALDDFSYVVILADRGEYWLLWTAYYMTEQHRRDKLRREYERIK